MKRFDVTVQAIRLKMQDRMKVCRRMYSGLSHDAE